MHYNQFAQITGPSLQRSITLRPPPLLSPDPFTRDPKSKQKTTLKQLKPSKQPIKPVLSSMQSKIFQTETQDKTHRNLQEMIKTKLRMSEYASTPNNQFNQGLPSRIGSKKLHKKKDKIKQIALIKHEEKANIMKRIDKLLVNSEYDEFINTHIEDKKQWNQDITDTHRISSSSLEKSKEQEFHFNKFRSSSVVAISRSSNHKRIKLVLKSNRRLPNDFQHPMQKNTNNKSESKLLDYTPLYDEHEIYSHFRHEREFKQTGSRQELLMQRQKSSEFHLKKRILQKLNPRKLEKKIDNSSKVSMDIECIDAWKNKEQINENNSTHRVQEIETQENEICEFVERQIHPC